MSRDDRMRNASNALRQRLMQLNDATADAIRGHLECAVNNFIANGRWRFLDDNGPKIERVAEKEPIMWKWVTYYCWWLWWRFEWWCWDNCVSAVLAYEADQALSLIDTIRGRVLHVRARLA